MLDRLETLRRAGALTDLDVHFARLAARVGDGDDRVTLAAALASQWTAQGHICVDLKTLAATTVGEGTPEIVPTPPWEAWVEALRKSPAVGRPGEFAPLVLDESGRLYLYRYWEYERAVAQEVTARLRDGPADVDLGQLRRSLDRLFPASSERPDWQRIAAAVAALRCFTVISGGPGTGKTTTVVRLLALLLEQPAGRPLRIGLAAPTGKAAARMQEVIRAAKRDLAVSQAVRDAMPEQASTIHRLLGWQPGTTGFRHDQENPLALDVLIVDEASMVDLALMAKLLRALPRTARLVLVGDRDQLASVEAGAVLGDICGAALGVSSAFRRRVIEATGDDPGGGGHGPAIRDAIVVLQRSYRFGGQSGIGRTAQLVNRGEGRDAFRLVAEGGMSDVGWRTVETARDLRKGLPSLAVNGYRETALAAEPGAALAALDRFRILCAHRSGPFGLAEANGLAEEGLAAAGLLAPRGVWYRGRPVVITRNDYHLRLFNGDVGMALPDPQAGQAVRVFFRTAQEGVRRIPPARLPAHETAFAATVHRSQGSETDRVVLILPDQTSPVATRELIYTAITRARSHAEIWGTRSVFEAAVARRLTRSSGLRDALWEAG